MHKLIRVYAFFLYIYTHMSLYNEYFSFLTETSTSLFFLGYVGRKDFNKGKIEVKQVEDDDARHPAEWSQSGITWKFVPEVNMLTFWEDPTKEELIAVKEWIENRGYKIKRTFNFGKSFRIKKSSPGTSEMDRKPLGMDETKNKKYCAVLLDSASQNKLKKLLSGLIPESWTIKCHHMTIDPFNECTVGIGESVNLMLTHFGRNDKACAVKVVGYKGKTNNAFPHVTIAVNESAGGKAKDSNTITEWTPISKHITLTGTVENL